MWVEQIAVLNKSQSIYDQSIEFAFHFYQWNTRSTVKHVDYQQILFLFKWSINVNCG